MIMEKIIIEITKNVLITKKTSNAIPKVSDTISES